MATKIDERSGEDRRKGATGASSSFPTRGPIAARATGAAGRTAGAATDGWHLLADRGPARD